MMDRVMGGARAGTAIIGAMTGVRVAQMRYAQDNGAGLIGSGSGESAKLAAQQIDGLDSSCSRQLGEPVATSFLYAAAVGCQARLTAVAALWSGSCPVIKLSSKGILQPCEP